MLTYRCFVYKLAMAASADATALALSLSTCVYREQVRDELPNLTREADLLQDSVGKLLTALPSDVREAVHGGRTGLCRHLGYVQSWLAQGDPDSCVKDPVDMVKHDLPAVLALFDDWHERHSPGSASLSNRLAPFVTTGQLNAAVREAWALFKSRMVALFELPVELDGHRLFDRLFGTHGATAGLLSDSDRQGYANLFKGLYTLNRNPISHNDMPLNPEEIDAVLALVNSALSKVEGLAAQQSDVAQWNVVER